jgi:hypothetical protein
MPKPSLDDILNGPDPLGILHDDTPIKARTTVDDRTKAGFDEINSFVDSHGREPAEADGADIKEKGLSRRLQTIRANPSLVAALAGIDRHGLLAAGGEDETSTPKSLDEILDLIDDEGDDDSIFSLRHVKPREELDQADFVARRQPCRDFDKFKPLFEKVQRELELGVRKSVEFKVEKEIDQGQFFILKGLIAYVAEVGETFVKNGKENARIRTIFSNGTELNNLRRSLAKELYRYGDGRRITDPLAGVLFGGEPEATDIGTGTIYVLRSLSNDPNVAPHRNILHKIGVTSTSVERRIANAENDATYLLAPVEIVASYELFNINSTKLENMLHRFFDAARAQITIPDRFGKPVQPREWFFVPLSAIREVVKRLEDGSITRSRYDPSNASIVDI